MAQLKHVGKISATGKKVLVAFRTLPGDAYNCLVIPTEQLDESKHNAIISLVESIAGQQAYEFAEALHRTQFPDGSNMLAWLYANNKLVKVATDKVEMVPVPGYTLVLSELNQQIAESKGVAVDDLSIKDSSTPAKPSATKQPEIIPEVVETTVEQPVSISLEDYLNTVEREVENLSAQEKATRYKWEADKLSKDAANLRSKAESLQPVKKTTKSSTKEKSV